MNQMPHIHHDKLRYESEVVGVRQIKYISGNNVTATGAGKDSNIHIVGCDVSGINSTSLSADNDVTLESAQSTSSEHSTNSSSGWSAGVAFSQGFSVTASVNQANGNGDGHSVTQDNSHVGSSTGTTTITAGGTNTLAGAQVTGNRVNVTTENLVIAT